MPLRNATNVLSATYVEPLRPNRRLEKLLLGSRAVIASPTALPSPYSRYSKGRQHIPHFKLNRQTKIPSYHPTNHAEFVGHAQLFPAGLVDGNLCAGVTAGKVCPCATSLPRHLSRAARDQLPRSIAVPGDSTPAEQPTADRHDTAGGRPALFRPRRRYPHLAGQCPRR